MAFYISSFYTSEVEREDILVLVTQKILNMLSNWWEFWFEKHSKNVTWPNLKSSKILNSNLTGLTRITPILHLYLFLWKCWWMFSVEKREWEICQHSESRLKPRCLSWSKMLPGLQVYRGHNSGVVGFHNLQGYGGFIN